MHMYSIGILRRWARCVSLPIQPRGVILAYHRVADLESDPQLLSVTPQHFAQHLEHIRDCYRPMSLVELGHALTAKRIPRRAVVITFDDGYRDNLWNAMPVLEQYDMPATVFVTTGHVGQNREFWWDELERILILPIKLPEKLEIEVDGRLYKWDLHESVEQRTSGSRWNVAMENYTKRRHGVYVALHGLLRPLEAKKQNAVLRKLATWAGASGDTRIGYYALGADELKKLSDNGQIEVGSHTITHPVLSAQSTHMQQTEITQSKRYLEEILGHPVMSFSYPYGGKDDVAADTIQMVREAGYRVACANFHALVTRNSYPYWLPRYLVRDWNGHEFAKHLRRFFRSYD